MITEFLARKLEGKQPFERPSFLEKGEGGNSKVNYEDTGGTLLVAQLAEALRYQPEGRGFDSR